VSNVGVDTTALALVRRDGGGPTLEILCTRRLEAVYDVDTLVRALALFDGGIEVRCTIAEVAPARATCAPWPAARCRSHA